MVVRFHCYNYLAVIGFLKGKSGQETGKYIRKEKECTGASQRIETSQWEDLFRLSETIKRDLDSGIRLAAIKKQQKQELLATLSSLLQSYTALTASRAYPFRVAINHFIENETAKHCLIHLDTQELLLLWRDVRMK
jgi:hypothetical protein